MAEPRIEVIIECTGHPAAGIRHALAAIRHGKHVVMVNVEADVLAGPLLAAKARAAGVVYSLAYGDQPALVCELVDTIRAMGLPIVAAGKGTKYLPTYHESTPATVWGHYGLTEEQARLGGMNPQMFNSFLDGTKSGIEMAAIANATGLAPPEDGLRFPPCATHDLPQVFAGAGGVVEVISSLERDGRQVVGDLRWGSMRSSRARPTTSAGASPNTACTPTLRPLRGAMAALPPDRAGARRLGRQRGAARRADRAAGGLARRRGQHRQARPGRGRGAGWRGRRHGLGQMHPRGAVARPRRPADRAGAWGAADPGGEARRDGGLGRCHL
ncbi:hypothetical protein ACFQY5_32020 [Paeniroseomonas aquatica]|uniref:hypothetical protein n=1 Tax=Paeniroseomonas aquatica TaxID=373043 RepID=UPI0036167732